MNQPLTTKIFHVATDHAGFEHKEAIVAWLTYEGYVVVDHGAKSYDSDDDFPDFIALAAAAVSSAPEESLGLIFGGSGQGEAMVANRFPNVRATVFYGGSSDIIELSRAHNDANVLSFGARFVSVEEIKISILNWLKTPVLKEEKYRRRNQKIERLTRTLRNL
jgi:ribose 5-phosphate isomerase B